MAEAKNATSASQKLQLNEVVPDVVDQCSDDIGLVKLAGLCECFDTVELTPSQTHPRPRMNWPGEAETLYAVIVTDPDAISRENPIFREFVHFVALNVRGNSMDDNTKCDVALPYVGPGPPCNSGLHRYVTLVYKQKEKMEVGPVAALTEGRGGKRMGKWATEQGLELVAGNVYEAQWEEAVDGFHVEMGFAPPYPYQSPSQLSAGVVSRLTENEVTPDVVEKLPASPLGLGTAKYNGLETAISMDKCVFKLEETNVQPQITWSNSDPEGIYTVFMTDPDAVARKEPLFREFAHYAAVNVNGTGEGGDVALEYVGPAPPCNSELHRYVFLVYKQTKKLDAKPLADYLAGRGGKKCNVWALEQGLTLVAANLFEAEWSEFCDEAHISLGFMPPEKYQSPSQKEANKRKVAEKKYC